MKIRMTVLAAALLLASGLAQLAMAQDAVRQVRGPIWISVPATAGAMQSEAIKAPANGYVMVTVTGTFNYSHTYGTAGSYCLQLSTTSGYTGGCVPDAGSDSAVRGYVAAAVPTTIPGFGASEQYSIIRQYTVSAGGTYTFYLNGWESGLPNTWLFQPTITVLFVPGALPA